jgi:hypothetical protein
MIRSPSGSGVRACHPELGRPRGRYPTFAGYLARLTAAGPHATGERLIGLERVCLVASEPVACRNGS